METTFIIFCCYAAISYICGSLIAAIIIAKIIKYSDKKGYLRKDEEEK